MVRKKRARRGGNSMYGGSPSIISVRVIPSDQISTFLPAEAEKEMSERKRREGGREGGRAGRKYTILIAPDELWCPPLYNQKNKVRK